jgi:hypothetical protein
MTFYGCRNILQAYIINCKTGEAYFYTFHTYNINPHTQFKHVAQTTYKLLLLNGWKPLRQSEIEAITKIRHKKGDNNKIWYIPFIVVSHIAVYAVLCVIKHKYHSNKKQINRKIEFHH